MMYVPKFLIKDRNKLIIDMPQLAPAQILVIGFLFLILIGTVLLSLPISSNSGTSTNILDSLFTATSAVCVTGLSVVNTMEHWSLFGKIVIICLIQIGGLGFMTLVTSLFVFLGRKITLRERLIMQESLNQYSLQGIVRLTKNVIKGTFIIEGIGAFLLSIKFIPQYGFSKGIFMGIFHSISAFCNAGFDIIGGNSFSPYRGDILVNFTLMVLIILGGLGFSVWIDFGVNYIKKRKKGFSWIKLFKKLTLHTKLVFVITTLLIIIPFIFFFIVEYNNVETLGHMNFKDKILGALFQSITTRTAGFNTIPLDKLTDASKFMTIILMFIGGSPAGTAGGIKTVTIGVIFLTVRSVIKGKNHTEIFNRRIPHELVQRALTVIIIGLGVVIGVTMILSLSESFTFMETFFETVSAFGTTGLTLGITSKLTDFGKIIIAITMFIGRLGPVTVAIALSIKQNKNKATIKYPEEKVLVG
ncbi:TrkH family potassium uptake protein [Defluviitalea phaphyphila]|uniref:TrkH family potassium uptake protein n=1 Tax=Defluviitalea phaphyphila TaxID=1473580 RepID=UPI0007310F1B|nr:TrkH family potassium uptake protein [Defluviitalea phaphyphila]